MQENFKYIAKLSGSALFSFIKINLLGTISTIIVVVIGFFLLTQDVNVGSSGHATPIPFIIATFILRPVSTILFSIVFFSSSALFLTFGNKYIISKLVNRITIDKGEGYLVALLDKLMLKYKQQQPAVLRNAGDFTIQKLKVIQDIKNDKTVNKWLRKVIVLGMEKIRLDGIEFNDENQNPYEIIRNRTIESLKNIMEPSRKMIWMIFALQWAILLFIWSSKF